MTKLYLVLLLCINESCELPQDKAAYVLDTFVGETVMVADECAKRRDTGAQFYADSADFEGVEVHCWDRAEFTKRGYRF